MLENSIRIESKKDVMKYITIDIHNLRDVEQSILNYMLLSKVNFLDIKNKLSEDDFTFIIHKVIFKNIVLLEEIFLSDNFHGATDINLKLNIFADILEEKQNVKRVSTLDILSQPPSIYIDKDLEIINVNSMEKEVALTSRGLESRATIESKDGTTWLDFVDDRLVSIKTTNIAKLPVEVHDTLTDTMQSLGALDLKNGDNEASMTVYGDPDNPNGIESFYLKKDVQKLKWFDDICKWADKYQLNEDVFPRNREELQEQYLLDVSNKGITELPKEIIHLSKLIMLVIDNNNIKELPVELYQMKNLRLLSFMKNQVSFISEDIMNLDLITFGACHNNITELPMSFFTLKNLETLCLHGNKIKVIPNEIGNLSSLESFTISNNDIKALPQSMSNLKNLKSIDIENTQISSIPADLLKFNRLNALSINDDLLPQISDNMQYLDVDTINLSASYFEEYSQVIEELNCKITMDSWVEDRDKKENGCIQFLKSKVEEDDNE